MIESEKRVREIWRGYVNVPFGQRVVVIEEVEGQLQKTVFALWNDPVTPSVSMGTVPIDKTDLPKIKNIYDGGFSITYNDTSVQV